MRAKMASKENERGETFDESLISETGSDDWKAKLFLPLGCFLAIV